MRRKMLREIMVTVATLTEAMIKIPTPKLTFWSQMDSELVSAILYALLSYELM